VSPHDQVVQQQMMGATANTAQLITDHLRTMTQYMRTATR
jgi:hypothetical protein